MMKKSVETYAIVLLMCLGLTSSVRATLVDANDEWGMTLQVGESFTCLAHFIPDIPNVVPESLIFTRPPEWTNSYPFNYEAAGWDVALADGGKTAYLFGPKIANTGPGPLDIFSYKLYYQWDDDGLDFDPNYPVYLDWVIFDDLTLIQDSGWRRKADGTWEWPANEITWREQYYPESEPYENPVPEVPEPMVICLLGLGAAFLRKRR
jgi:hypothetical protein